MVVPQKRARGTKCDGRNQDWVEFSVQSLHLKRQRLEGDWKGIRTMVKAMIKGRKNRPRTMNTKRRKCRVKRTGAHNGKVTLGCSAI